MAIRDTRLDTLAERGIMGEDAETSLERGKHNTGHVR